MVIYLLVGYYNFSRLVRFLAGPCRALRECSKRENQLSRPRVKNIFHGSSLPLILLKPGQRRTWNKSKLHI